MSSTPLIEIENIVKLIQRREEYTTHALYETQFQGWTAKAEIEWDTATGTLVRYWLRIKNPKSDWREVEIDGHRTWDDIRTNSGRAVNGFMIHFSGFGAITSEESRHYIDTLNVAYEIAKELNDRHVKGKIPMPKIEELNKTIWIVGSPEIEEE